MKKNDIIVISTAIVVSAIIVASTAFIVTPIAVAFSPTYKRLDHSPPTIPLSDTVDHWAIWTEALIEVESGGDNYAVGRTNDWGCLQITPILVREVNRIQSERKFSMNDAKDRNKSIEMYNIIQAYYNPGHDRHLALKIWNPRAPVSYHKRVEEEYNKLIRITKGE
jgi:hypothetical protein